MKTDIHSHILPGIDDGARHFAESEKILTQLQAEGIECLAFTPHFYPAKCSVDRFLQERSRSQKRLAESSLFSAFQVSFGAEVYLTEALFNYDEIEKLAYTGTKLILTELEYGVPYTRAVERKLERLINDCSLTPVLAHIERFSDLLNHPDRVAYLREMGCLCQMNLQGFADFWQRRRMIRLVQAGMVDFLGQDLHQEAMPKALREKALRELQKAAPEFADRCDAFAREEIFH